MPKDAARKWHGKHKVYTEADLEDAQAKLDTARADLAELHCHVAYTQTENPPSSLRPLSITLRTCRRTSAGHEIRHRSLQRTLNGRSEIAVGPCFFFGL